MHHVSLMGSWHSGVEKPRLWSPLHRNLHLETIEQTLHARVREAGRGQHHANVPTRSQLDGRGKTHFENKRVFINNCAWVFQITGTLDCIDFPSHSYPDA